MGAPGNALFCENGHMVLWMPEHLYWDDEMFEELEKFKNNPCEFCGRPVVLDVSHYGGLNDCMPNENTITIIDHDTTFVKVPNAMRKSPTSENYVFIQFDVFLEQTIPKYDLSKVPNYCFEPGTKTFDKLYPKEER